DNTITDTPAKTYPGSDSFSYTIMDSYGATATATVSVQVGPINNPPGAVNDSATTKVNTSVNINVLMNDSDPDHDKLTIVTIPTPPAHGKATINSGGTVITYTPASGFKGTDSFFYQISDGRGGTATATV